MICMTSSNICADKIGSYLSAVCLLKAPAVKKDQTWLQLCDCFGYPCWGWSKILKLCPPPLCCTIIVFSLSKITGKYVLLQKNKPALCGVPFLFSFHSCDFLSLFHSTTDAKAALEIVCVPPPYLVLHYSWSSVLHRFHGASHFRRKTKGTVLRTHTLLPPLLTHRLTSFGILYTN